MSDIKKALLQELTRELKALQELQTKSPDVINYIPADLKQAIRTSTEILKENSNKSNKGKPKKKKSICDKMNDNWQKHIIEPFTNEIQNIKAASAVQLYNLADKLAKDYYDKWSKKRWFNPNRSATSSKNYLNYIAVFPIKRDFNLRRDVTIDEFSERVETPSTYSGPLNKSLSKPIQIGINDIVEIVIPNNSSNQLILNGQLDYELDSLTVPDTFVLKDGSTTIYSEIVKGGTKRDSIPFGKLNGNLMIDVQESEDTSIWEVSIHIEFLQITFNVPECQEDIPCPDISNPYK